MHPYRPDLVQKLVPGDYNRRLTFIAWFMMQLHDEPDFLRFICWTDESKFTNNGIINKQNNRYWADHNPYWTTDTNHQTVWGTNVWCGLLDGRLLGPYFYDGTLTGRRYLKFLTDVLPIYMDDIPLESRTNLFFQQDGAPAHNAIVVREYLQNKFGNRWMGTYGAVAWPPRSPDLTPLDFFLWGHLKNEVYSTPPLSIQDLKNKIVIACAELKKEQILAATQREVIRRFQSCMENDGQNFEQFLDSY